jgi:hypothetical protein
MKRRILGILIAALTLSMVFAMISCGGGDKKPANVTITFKDGYSGATIGDPVIIPRDTAIPADKFPGNPTRPDTDDDFFIFAKWIVGGVTPEQEVFSAESPTPYKFPVNRDVLAKWDTYDKATNAKVTFKVGSVFTSEAAYIASLADYDEKAVVKGQSIGAANFPAPPTAPKDFTFGGWYGLTGSTISETIFTATTPVSASITVVATFDAVEEEEEGYVTISFNLGGYAGAPVIEPIKIEEGTSLGIHWPHNPTRHGFVFGGWWDVNFSVQYTAATEFSTSRTLYARWIEDVLTADTTALELLYLENQSIAIYKFEIPAGHDLTEYGTLTAQYRISAAVLDNFTARVSSIRLLGIYDDAFVTANASTGDVVDPDPQFHQSAIKYLSRVDYSTPYIMDNGNTASSTESSITANQWFTVTYDLSGSRKHADAVAANVTPTAAHTGTLYFALGLSGQNSDKGRNRSLQFLQLIKDIKLVPKTTAPEVLGAIPEATLPQFVCYNDPIVFAWRGAPTQANIDNPPLPTVVIEEYEGRGDPPADADLREVVLGVAGSDLFTYIKSGGNTNNQRGWLSFGGAPADNISTSPSSVAFSNFKNAWYLVLETTEELTGELSVAWMGKVADWKGQTKVVNNGAAAIDGTSWITGTGPYTVKILLTKLDDYKEFYEDNTEWAGFSLSYWGSAPSGDAVALGITKAYLLVDKDDVVGSVAGLSVGVSFSLGTAPAGGNIIDDVRLNSAGELVISAAPGLSDYKWYVAGVLEATETEKTLTIDTPTSDYIITLLAKRGTAWASQTVSITVGN